MRIMKDGWTETGGIIGGGGGVCQLKPGNKEVTQSRSGEKTFERCGTWSRVSSTSSPHL